MNMCVGPDRIELSYFAYQTTILPLNYGLPTNIHTKHLFTKKIFLDLNDSKNSTNH